jgi:hypothetical protein
MSSSAAEVVIDSHRHSSLSETVGFCHAEISKAHSKTSEEKSSESSSSQHLHNHCSYLCSGLLTKITFSFSIHLIYLSEHRFQLSEMSSNNFRNLPYRPPIC